MTRSHFGVSLPRRSSWHVCPRLKVSSPRGVEGRAVSAVEGWGMEVDFCLMAVGEIQNSFRFLCRWKRVFF